MLPCPAALQIGGAWPEVLLLGGIAALLALDETSFAQTWFGQPLPAALLAGLCCGDLQTGLLVGLSAQLVVLANVPIGQPFIGDTTTAAIATVGAVLLGGPGPLTAGAPLDAIALGRLGWLLIGLMLMSLLGSQVIGAERQAHMLWMQEGHRSLRDGSLARIERLQLRCLLASLLRGFVMLICYLLLLAEIWLPLGAGLPAVLLPALAVVPVMAPAVGIGALVEQYGLQQGARWLIAGLGVALLWEVVLG